MLQANVFASHADDLDAYGNVEEDANNFLVEHPEVKLVASHTNMVATEEWTEFSLTLIVELPDVVQPE